VDIQWQNAQSLFQIIVAFDLAIPIFCGFAQSNSRNAQQLASNFQRRLHAVRLDIVLIERLERSEEWRGPSVLDELRAIYEPIEKRYIDSNNKIEMLDERMSKESIFYILLAITDGIFFTAAIFYGTIHPLQNLRLSTVWGWGLAGLGLPLLSLTRTAGKQVKFSGLSGALNQQVIKMLDLTLEMQRSRTDQFNDRPDIQLKQFKDGGGAAVWSVVDPSKPRSGF
jgi:hypothetical protein